MLNYDVPATSLAPFVPRGTSLDLWQGRALVSVVGFRFLDTRVVGVPIPFHRDFDEVNLRFYVRREMSDGEVRRGVVFVRELVPRPLIAWVARALYNEPYRALPMRSEVPSVASDTPGLLRYAWRRRTANGLAWEHVAARVVGGAAVPDDGTEAQFITEHYWGYTPQRDGSTVEYEVRHPSWHVWAGEAPELRVDVATLYGAEFAEPLAGAPRSTFIADGSAVSVHWPRRLR
jgi:uncharacterized protein YqjF (DUF2071 family)